MICTASFGSCGRVSRSMAAVCSWSRASLSQRAPVAVSSTTRFAARSRSRYRRASSPSPPLPNRLHSDLRRSRNNRNRSRTSANNSVGILSGNSFYLGSSFHSGVFLSFLSYHSISNRVTDRVFHVYSASLSLSSPPAASAAMAGVGLSEAASRLQEAELRREDAVMCRLCFEQRRNALLLDCGHTHFCFSCCVLQQKQNMGCGLCRQPISAVVRLRRLPVPSPAEP